MELLCLISIFLFVVTAFLLHFVDGNAVPSSPHQPSSPSFLQTNFTPASSALSFQQSIMTWESFRSHSQWGRGPCFSVWPCCLTLPCESPSTSPVITVGMLMSLMAGSPPSIAPFMPGLMAHRLSIELAILRINEEGFLPKNATLVGLYADTKGDDRNTFMATLRCIMSTLDTVRVPLAFGAMTSRSTTITASLTTEWSLPTISGSATAATLTYPAANKAKYPFFTRAAPSDAAISLSFAVLCKYMKWSKVATIASNDDFSNSLIDTFSEAAKSFGIDILMRSQLINRANNPIELAKIKLSGVRIIVLAVQVDDLRTLWTTATELGMTTAPYVWINPSPELRLIEAPFIGLLAAAPFVNRSTPEYLKFAGLWSALYQRDTRLTYNLSQPGTWSPWWYDGVWAAAYAMRSMMNQGWNFSSTDEKYKASLRLALNRSMYQLDFVGASGRYRLNELGDRLNVPIEFTNMRRHPVTGRLNWYPVGLWTPSSFTTSSNASQTNTSAFDMINQLNFDIANVIWLGDRRNVIPLDQPVLEYTFATVSTTLFWTIAVLCILGGLFAMALLAWNIYYREEPIIRASSPRVNNVILFGAMLCYVSAVLYGVDAATLPVDGFDDLCQIKSWVFACAFTLFFGGLFSKTLRVHLIFNNQTPQKMLVSDSRVFMYLGVQLLIDAVILLNWYFVDPPTMQLISLPPIQQSLDVVEMPRLQRCVSSMQSTFSFIMLAYKAGLVLFGAYLAFNTRHVSVPAFNDSRYIGLSIYTVSIVSFVTLPVLNFLSEQDSQNVRFGLVSLAIFFLTTVSLLILFGVKIVAVMTGSQDEFMKSAAGNAVPRFKSSRNSSGMGSANSKPGSINSINNSSANSNLSTLTSSTSGTSGTTSVSNVSSMRLVALRRRSRTSSVSMVCRRASSSSIKPPPVNSPPPESDSFSSSSSSSSSSSPSTVLPSATTASSSSSTFASWAADIAQCEAPDASLIGNSDSALSHIELMDPSSSLVSANQQQAIIEIDEEAEAKTKPC